MLLCSDYDRTLRMENEIAADVRSEIDRFRALGHHFCINTGRAYHNMLEELEEREFDASDFYIAGSGSQIFDQHGAMMAGIEFEEDTARRVVEEIFQAASLSCVFGEQDRWQRYWKEDCAIWDSSIVEADFEQIYTISTRFKTEEEALWFQAHLESVCAVSAYVNRSAVDIVSKHVSKATGIDVLRKLLGLKKEQVFVIGDSSNDLPMIEAYQGFCVDNAEPEVAKKASRSFADVGACIRYLIDNQK